MKLVKVLLTVWSLGQVTVPAYAQEVEPEFCFPPIAEYINYWSGEQLTEQDMSGLKLDIIEIKMMIDMSTPEELPVYQVQVSKFGVTGSDPIFFVGEYEYTRPELENELDEGNFD